MSTVTNHVAVGVRLNVNCDQLMLVKLVSAPFVMTMPVSMNHVTSSEKLTVMVRPVLVYQTLSPVSVIEGAVVSIHVTSALTVPVDTSPEISKSNIPLIANVYVYGSGTPHGLLVTTTQDSSNEPMVAVTLPLVAVDGA